MRLSRVGRVFDSKMGKSDARKGLGALPCGRAVFDRKTMVVSFRFVRGMINVLIIIDACLRKEIVVPRFVLARRSVCVCVCVSGFISDFCRGQNSDILMYHV